jgi:hypothetical protein
MMHMDTYKDLELRNTAEQLYQRATRHGWLRRWWDRLRGQAGNALPLYTDVQIQQPANPPAVQSVPISQIVGTTQPIARVDRQFRPCHPATRQPWLRVALAHLRGDALPPVELVDMDGRYLVQDGHLRISVAHTLGQNDIDAIVLLTVRTPQTTLAVPASTPVAAHPQHQGAACASQQHA